MSGHVNILEAKASQILGLELYKLGRTSSDMGVDLVCIGTDRATGDSLGPLVGELLKTKIHHLNGLIRLFGTLDNPVHANNLDTLHERVTAGRLVIAVDACLGKPASIGNITIGHGCVFPGASMMKNLPPVGDIFITGVVNTRGGSAEIAGAALQSTRLAVVMKMARVIAKALLFGCRMLYYENEFIQARRSEQGCCSYNERLR